MRSRSRLWRSPKPAIFRSPTRTSMGRIIRRSSRTARCTQPEIGDGRFYKLFTYSEFVSDVFVAYALVRAASRLISTLLPKRLRALHGHATTQVSARHAQVRTPQNRATFYKCFTNFQRLQFRPPLFSYLWRRCPQQVRKEKRKCFSDVYLTSVR